jgi:hypothetical protein
MLGQNEEIITRKIDFILTSRIDLFENVVPENNRNVKWRINQKSLWKKYIF